MWLAKHSLAKQSDRVSRRGSALLWSYCNDKQLAFSSGGCSLDGKFFVFTLLSMVRPRKPDPELRSKLLQVRVHEVEHETFQAAAKGVGLALSSWVRTRLLEAAKKDLRPNAEPPAKRRSS